MVGVPAGHRRVSFDVPDELYDELLAAKVAERYSLAARIRVLVRLWAQDEELRARVVRELEADWRRSLES